MPARAREGELFNHKQLLQRIHGQPEQGDDHGVSQVADLLVLPGVILFKPGALDVAQGAVRADLPFGFKVFVPVAVGN